MLLTVIRYLYLLSVNVSNASYSWSNLRVGNLVFEGFTLDGTVKKARPPKDL